VISRSLILILRNVSDKSCRENQNTHFVFNNFIFENRMIYEKMWKFFCLENRTFYEKNLKENMVEPDRPQMTRAHAHFTLRT